VRVAVVGPGAIGATFGAAAEAGHEVVLCGRRPAPAPVVERPDGSVHALAHECVAVARAEGAGLEARDAEAVIAQLAAYPPDLGTSILFDRLAGRPMEWDARNGVVRRFGRAHGIATPVSDVLVPLLAALSPG
jgi:2-dehydropantoate 2-reductase